MKKIIIILLCLISVVFFGALVYYGARHTHGVPVIKEKIERVVLESPLIEEQINLSQGIAESIWDVLKPTKIKLMHQLMVLPWPKNLTPEVLAKSFHNGQDIYFYLEWQDDTEDRELGINKFSDACGIMFPLKDQVHPETIMMGFIGRANIWQWKGSQDKEFWLKEEPKITAYVDYHYPFEDKETLTASKVVLKSSANDLIAIRAGTITPKEAQDVSARGFWQDGLWKVVFKRSLKVVDPDNDALFNLGKKRLLGFAVWNGANGERGGRKSVSEFTELDVK